MSKLILRTGFFIATYLAARAISDTFSCGWIVAGLSIFLIYQVRERS